MSSDCFLSVAVVTVMLHYCLIFWGTELDLLMNEKVELVITCFIHILKVKLPVFEVESDHRCGHLIPLCLQLKP